VINRSIFIDGDEVGSPETIKKWLTLNCKALFETELEKRHTDENARPMKITFTLLQQWFSYQCCFVHVDAVIALILDNDTCH